MFAYYKATSLKGLTDNVKAHQYSAVNIMPLLKTKSWKYNGPVRSKLGFKRPPLVSWVPAATGSLL